MKSFYFLSFFLLTVSLSAQTTFSDDKKWEIGVDFLPFIDTTYFVRNSILFRRQINDVSKLRWRLGIAFEDVKNRPFSLILNNAHNKDLIYAKPFQGYLSVGYERYLNNGRISVFTGGDIFGTYYRDLTGAELDTRPLAMPPTIYKVRDLYQEYKLGLNLLAGVNVRIIQYLYVSTETYLQTAYRWQKGDYRQYEGEDLKLTISGGRIIKRFIVDLQPVSAIHLIYQF
jgi:hypothetical protein